MSPYIAIVGSVNVDLVFRAPRLPAVGETLLGHSFQQIRGGKGANQAVAAARLGAPVLFVGAVGDDAFGADARNGLNAEGINVEHLTVIAHTATGVAGIVVQDDGDNSIVLAAGANAALSTVHIDNASTSIRQARLLICQLETPITTVTHAINIARQNGGITILNPAPAQDLDDALLRQVDYLILNEVEARQLSGIAVNDPHTAQDAAQILLQRGVGAVIVTLGEQGAICCTANDQQTIAAHRVKVVDTTAAGDTFVGAFAVSLLQGLTIDQACAQAQSAAAITVTRLGAQTSIPTRAELETFIQKNQP